MPKRAQFTLQATCVVARNPLDSSRAQSQHDESSHVILAYELAMPMHCYMVQSTYPQTYNKDVGNPLWQATMHMEYESLLKNQTWDSVPLPP
jgi:hypothetical protein